jgi:hypothetical protein
MVASLIREIDDLLDSSGPPITSSSSKAAKGAVQDLLRGHGFSRVPIVSSSLYGEWKKRTNQALVSFCKVHRPAAIVEGNVPKVDRETLLTLLNVAPKNPIASQVYVTRVLNLPFTGLNRLACLVAIGEGLGTFSAICLNTDRAGLSLGLIQWAQYPERLKELLEAVPKARLIEVMGSEEIAKKVVAHSKLRGESPKVRGGVKRSDGKPNDPAMDFTVGDWPSKFSRLCRFNDVQVAQIQLAAAAFQAERAKFDVVSTSAKSERLVAYLLDVANQFGKPASKFYKAAIDQGGLPTELRAEGIEIIRRVTIVANEVLRSIGETVVNGKPKWQEAFILKVQKSRTDRAKFFTDWDGLADTAI